jgi:hypothetical protein
MRMASASNRTPPSQFEVFKYACRRDDAESCGHLERIMRRRAY